MLDSTDVLLNFSKEELSTLPLLHCLDQYLGVFYDHCWALRSRVVFVFKTSLPHLLHLYFRNNCECFFIYIIVMSLAFCIFNLCVILCVFLLYMYKCIHICVILNIYVFRSRYMFLTRTFLTMTHIPNQAFFKLCS